MALKHQGMVMKIIRKFSAPMRDTNQCFIAKEKTTYKQTSVLFVVLEHFSLMSFTCAVDCLVTSNLVEGSTRFTFATVGLGNGEVLSDLGIGLTPDHSLDEVKALQDIDAVIVCGGYRTCLNEHPQLSKLIALSSKCNTILGGIWNGAIFLAHAGVLDGNQYALHPDNHAYAKEKFPGSILSSSSYIGHENIFTSSGASSTLDMMLALVQKITSQPNSNAVREILSCDRGIPLNSKPQLQTCLPDSAPAIVKEANQLMVSNLDEPLHVEDIARYLKISRRKLERLFKTHIQTSPSKYYLELRLTYARQLLLQSEDSISTIAASTGFSSTTHFSRCFKEFFSVSPSVMRGGVHVS
ncbi:helix-turn-helix domain-containing protein [Vibrio sp. OCN044]|uniref:Helix-turn-helix domain-containing protein n=1 Tax=Vibrio tetraodonis subsp. pristinus TaxID=2695891 RepID=A0A6L8M260_9VIBR|nr:helix-turn-helix domain-containing protein [Vibrio tetraodonis]MYM59859.1 helix-turn-helix domain-containing protein [Vibrio tetraodonis subsp. pristinus]